ncbi:MAG: sugar phosphate nucleotidyltransferase, partial [Bacillota bacterium]|nr:sugar phosphate nucleotidyltransferase [Bacillota bacterium]
VKLAFKAAEDTNDLVIIGIKPTYPATGYGYIQIEGKAAGDAFPVRRFIEKPDIETAKKLTRSQNFLWNSGILLGNAETIADSVKQFLPDHFEKLAQAIKYIGKPDFSQRLDDAYSNIESISFDYGVLEKSSRIRAVRGVFDWDDIGSLDALAKTFRSDGKGNLVKGDHFGIGTSNCVIYSEDTPITTVGVDNMIIAVLKDTALICPRNRSQDIKSLVDLLRSNGCSYLT